MGTDRRLSGTQWLMASLYGTGCVSWNACACGSRNVDFDYRQIVVRKAKGAKDRMVPLPEALHAALRGHLGKVRAPFEDDRRLGVADVYLPNALAKKYPNAPKEWIRPTASIYKTCLSEWTPVGGPPQWQPAPSRARERAPEGGEAGRGSRRDHQADQVPCASPLLCHPPACGRLRHPHGAGASRPQGRVDHHDLHPCLEPRRAWDAEPAGRRGGLARLLHWCQPVCVRRVTTRTARLTRPTSTQRQPRSHPRRRRCRACGRRSPAMIVRSPTRILCSPAMILRSPTVILRSPTVILRSRTMIVRSPASMLQFGACRQCIHPCGR